MKQYRGGDPINRPLPFLTADISRDQQILGSFRRHPLVPENDGNRQSPFQVGGELTHSQDCRAFPSVQLQRKPQYYLPDFMLDNQ